METGLHNLAAIVFEGGVSNADEPSLTIQTIVNIWSKGRARKPITGHGIVKVLDVRKNYAGDYHHSPVMATSFTAFNTSRPPFDDRRVRRAFTLALDRQALVSSFLLNVGEPADGGYVPLGMPGYSPGIALPFDPQRARHLMTEAGYPGGHGFPEVTTSGPGSESSQTIAKFHIDQWKQNLNVKVNLQMAPLGKFQTSKRNLGSEIFGGGWVADFPDPANFLDASIPLLRTCWHDRHYEILIEQARHCLDQAQRMELYAQAQRILSTEAVIIPLIYMSSHFLKKPWLREASRGVHDGSTWKDIIIEPHD